MKNKSIAVIFPGQGSQFIGMGKEFMESEPEAAKLMDMADLPGTVWVNTVPFVLRAF